MCIEQQSRSMWKGAQVLVNSLAPTVEKWPAGPNFGRPYLLKFLVVLAGKSAMNWGRSALFNQTFTENTKGFAMKLGFLHLDHFQPIMFQTTNQNESPTTTIAFAF